MQANRGPRRKLLTFACSATATSIALVLTGWLTGMREVMHGTLLALAIVAFFPFVLVATGLMLGLGLSLLVILLSIFAGGDPGPLPDDMGPVVEGGAWLVPRYYRFWARRRHPGLWGVPFGGLAGCLLLGGLIVTLVLPGEATTVRTLEEARRRIETYYKQQGHYPDPGVRGRLTQAAFGGGRGMQDDIIRDGFGRPLLYRVSGRGRFASYSIKSLGFDGRPGRDDLCISGQTRLMSWADVAGNIARHVELRRGAIGEAVLNRLKGIHSLRCEQ
jgi:hypothetical protein